MAQKENVFLELFAYTVNGSKKNALWTKRKTFFWSCLHILLMAQKKENALWPKRKTFFWSCLHILLMAQKRKMPYGPKGKHFSGVVCIYC